MVRSRQIARKLAWWLALIGYDPHDHSLSHRIYLVYPGAAGLGIVPALAGHASQPSGFLRK
jgi:hypothetical protein